jgi:GNAT superfamily N-acetyltransferase
MNYTIKNITTELELDDAIKFAITIFGEYPCVINREKYIDYIMKNGDLLIYAESNGETVGIVFGFFEDNGNLTVGPVAVDARLRNHGVAREMMTLLEERVKVHGVHLIALGSVQTAEGFYKKLGYTGSLLIQSEKQSIEKMLLLNTKYGVRFTNVHECKIN